MTRKSPHRTARIATAVVTVAALTVLAACSSGNDTASTTPTATSTAPTSPAAGSESASADATTSEAATSEAGTTEPATSEATSAAPGDNGGATDTGVTAESILLGTTQPLTGPAAPGYSKISAAMKAYFDFVNENGGVNGRTIELTIADDGYNPANTAKLTRELVLQDEVFALVGSLGTPTHTSVLDFVAQNEVPDLFVSSGSRNWNQPDKYPTTFGWQPDYTVEGKILGNHVKNEFDGKKVCSFGQNDDFGADGVKGLEIALGAGGIADKQTYTPTNTNVGPQIGALQAAGCEVVVLFSVPGFTALALGTAAQLQFAPQWVISSVGADIPTLTGFLKEATVPLLEGAVSDSYLPVSTDTDNSWIAMFREINDSHNGAAEFDGNVLYGMALAFTTVQALQAAGPQLTREGLIAAVQKGGFTGPGRTPFRYSETDHSGFSGSQIVVVEKGVATPTGPVYVTDDTDAPLTEYTTEQPEAPANGLPG